MNFTNLPDSLPPPCGGRLLTDTDIVDMLRRAGAPPHRPEPGTLFAISSLRALINALASLRPKSEAERHHRRQDSTVEETIFEGCTLALKGIAMVVGGIEDELEWLTHDLPDPNDPRSWVEQHGRLISNYERAMRRL